MKEHFSHNYPFEIDKIVIELEIATTAPSQLTQNRWPSYHVTPSYCNIKKSFWNVGQGKSYDRNRSTKIQQEIRQEQEQQKPVASTNNVDRLEIDFFVTFSFKKIWITFFIFHQFISLIF